MKRAFEAQVVPDRARLGDRSAQADDPAAIAAAGHVALAGRRLRRLPLAVVPADALIAWLMKEAAAPVALCAGWFVAASALQVFVSCDAAAAGASADEHAALDRTGAACLAFGVLHALPVTIVLGEGDTERSQCITMLVAVLAVLGIVAAAGWVRAFALWSAPIVGSTCAGWLLAGGDLGIVLAALLLLLFVASAACVRDDARAVACCAHAARLERLRAATLLGQRDAAQAERARAEAASRAKTRFFAAASHDLRQSLHALAISATTVRVLAERSGNATLGRVGAGIGRALAESRGILDGLLDLSRLDAGAVKVRLECIDAVALIERVAEVFEPVARERGLALHVRIARSDRLLVRTDGDQLARILYNLVANALKFTVAGSVTLSAAPASDVAAVELGVIDTGVGIAEADQERIFDEFYQVERAGHDHAKGIGLGLAIVRRTAQLLGIEIRLRSELGVGSTFSLSIPAADGADSPSPSGAGVSRVVAPDEPALDVLLIDDDLEVLDSLAMLMESAGWRVACAPSCQRALELIRSGYKPQAVALDLRLRDGDSGLDTLRGLREAGFDAAVVLVSGETDPRQLEAARETGLPILYKPVDGNELLGALRQAVTNRAG